MGFQRPASRPMPDKYPFARADFAGTLRGVAEEYRDDLAVLHECLSRYSLLQRHSDFIQSIPSIEIGFLPLVDVLQLSLLFANMRASMWMEFGIWYRLTSPTARGALDRFEVALVRGSDLSYEGTISVTEYARHRGLDAYEALRSVDPARSLRTNIEHHLAAAEAILEGPMRDFLTGARWEPIPIDWGDYK